MFTSIRISYEIGIFLIIYSSVPNRRADPNKRAGGKILQKE